MSEPSINMFKFLGAIQSRLGNNIVGYAGVVGNAAGSPIPFAWGYARTAVDASPPVPFQTSTSFGMASVGKLLTAIAAVQLLDGGSVGGMPVYPNALQLGLDSPMVKALPTDWNIQDPAVKQITFRQLLAHMSGLAPENSPGEPGQDFRSLKAYLTQSSVPLVPAAQLPAYSNIGFALFRLLLPRLNGMVDNLALSTDQREQSFATAYAQIITTNIFAKVGVTGPDTRTPANQTFALGYAYPGSSPGANWATWTYGGQTAPGPGLPLVAGAGGWWVSIDQMIPVLESLNAIDGRILSAAQWTHLQGGNAPAGLQGHGLGIDVLVDGAQPGATGYRWVEKNGSSTNFNASVAFFGSVVPVAGAANGPVFALLFVNSDIAGPGTQSKWYWCSNCEALFFNGNGTTGVCPASTAGHVPGGQYMLASALGSPGQTGWKWCQHCQMLCFAPTTSVPSVCPAGGKHSCPSGPYIVNESGIANLEFQLGWQWCRKCGVLAFSPNGPGSCAAGAGHDFSQSGIYSLDFAGVGPDTVLLEAFRAAIE